ncbi:HsmA family protein [Butyricimonas faecihominis]|jgi:uncharacterized repeat protein (TIGR03987 family)|uniref:HsmA family protein n=1 Tax=Butyricimonas faecihominis TaxID=1472416 RepID=UPI0026705DE0|nr:HsmA family protein [Butyricimonas faecihominis]
MFFLGAAITSITLALVFYTIGTWAEKVQGRLKLWHIVFFLLGLVADSLGTAIMSDIAGQKGDVDPLHGITGILAIVLMAIHAVWAIVTYWKGNEKAMRNFSKFSVIVWAFWLIPYGLGLVLGMSH